MAAIICTSQQSRFYTETLDTPSKEIDLKTVNISIGKTDILVDSHLRLKAGVRYGLLGRNGTGKSTLFIAMRDGLIPGLPRTVRILLVSQTEADSAKLSGRDADDNEGPGTVIDKVMDSDRVRAKAMRDYEDLNKAIDSHSVAQMQKVVSRLELEKLQNDLDEKKKIASLRSGARGKEARKEEVEAEATLAEAQTRMAQLDLNSVDPLADATRLLADIQVTLDRVDYKTTTARAASILKGLGFTQEMIDGPYTSLSGGWRSRAALAGALLIGSEVLLLDEPTNFLDLPAMLWVESYLTESMDERTVVITSHDQDFLNRVVDETIYIRKQTLRYFEGTPAQLELHEKKDRRRLEKLQSAMDKKKSHIEASIKQGKAAGKKSGDDNKLRMAKSRQKKLDERWGIETSAKGTRFKLNRDVAGYFLTNRQAVEIEDQEPYVRIFLPQPSQLRTMGDLVTFDKVSFKYPRTSKLLLENVTFSLPQGGRIALVGANGQGKSTVANLVLQKLKPTSGSVTHHPMLKIGHYSQHSVEEIMASVQGSKITALQYFLEYFSKKGQTIQEGQAMECLGTLGLGAVASKTPVEGLSGGQKVRLAFSLIIFNPPTLLVLDEITTHLDLATIQALARALRSYEGAIILVTHDRWFCRTVVEGASLNHASEDFDEEEEDQEDGSEDEDDAVKPRGQVYRVFNGKVILLEGGMNEYVAKVEKSVAKRRAAEKQGT